MASEALEMSGAMVRVVAEPGAWLVRLRVTPLITPETVLVEVLMGTPSTVSEELSPAMAVRWKLPVTVKLPGTPEVLLTRARRAPLASLMTLAVTPMLGVLLMEAARLARVLLVEVMSMATGGLAPTEI